MEDEAMETVLVFAPHPDDDIIGCGGTMAHHMFLGQQVAVVYMTSGEAGSLGSVPADLAARREAEARQAAALLGIDALTFLRGPDGYLEYSRTGLDLLTSIIRSRQPSRVYLPHARDAVPDHQITHRLGMEAIRRAAGPWHPECGPAPWQVDTVLGYEVWTPLDSIGHCQDISAYMDLKMQALCLHHSQMEHKAYDQAIRGLNRYRGIMTGRGNYCECFQVLQARL